ncbi:hypothetical protein Btru_035007 [Bulinus truncatus]|nr:hypothetical protein Btru_035007 [Bulinus truncatus]
MSKMYRSNMYRTTVNNDPDTVNNDPATVNNDPVTVNNDPATVNNDPVTVNNDPVTVNNDPVTVNNDPVTSLPSRSTTTRLSEFWIFLPVISNNTDRLIVILTEETQQLQTGTEAVNMTGFKAGNELKKQNTSVASPTARATTAIPMTRVTCDVCGQQTGLPDLFSHQIRKKCLESKLKHDVVCAVKCMSREVRLHQRDLDLQHRQLTRQLTRSSTSLPEKTHSGAAISRTKEGILQCRNCFKSFKESQNRKDSCRWHLGPIVNIFGGTCSSCGRLDYQQGCILGYHEI